MDKILDDIKRLVRIPSVRSEPLPGMPFGAPVAQALAEMLSICERVGLAIYQDPAGYYGYAEIGTGDLFGVLCHLDVVPAGNESEWHHPPFEMVVDDQVVYGRGVLDDKGPSVIALQALVDLLAQGESLDHRVRFIFGLDEENEWSCIERYLADGQEIPVMGFVPDSSFPLTYAEKGLWQVELIAENEEPLKLQGGVAFNVVPGEVVYRPADQALIDELKRLGFETINEGSAIQVIGKNAHAAVAQEGRNALAALLHALDQLRFDSPAARLVSEKLIDGIHGEKLFENNQDEFSGLMTINLGLADITPQRQVLGLDIRYPVSIGLDYYRQTLADQVAAYGYRLRERSHLEPLHVDRDSRLVRSLMQAYQTISHDMSSEPQISGGATFARSMANVVAFGAHFPGREDTVHQPNECMTLSDMKLAYDIYQEAYKNLVIKEKTS